MKKILFCCYFSNNVHEITNEHLWLNGLTTIANMSDEHLRNARVWLHTVATSELAVYGTPCKHRGYTYKQWGTILRKEEERRIAAAEATKQLAIKTLENALANIKSTAANNIIVTKKSNGETNVRSVGYQQNSGKECYGSDHADQAFESFLSSQGY
jgi:hypothetical protein